MTKIDFYQVNGDEALFTCRLIDQVYRRGHQIYVHTSGEQQAKHLDDHLWIFRPDAFVPHVTHDSEHEAPIRIGFDHEPDDHQDVLVNLSGDIPLFFSRFDRVAEVVPVDQNSRESARKNYAFYKERGYVLEYHNINQS
ncbi:MAG: DNA polymerase III subunit chi [Pseudomonadales bacterium]|nr:DNA polymerase III subunit chi [Pseudomonadales bacterium]MBO6704335.1 DNA polymerase III subunit chi [Pseudomonadales bacterium]MBO7005366.1 DNA polymerase III subunit chi [Pseudomonadales bacterium]